MTDLDHAQITAALATTHARGRAFQFHTTTQSTNDDALAWMKAGAPDGAFVVADVQTHGRGREGRSWFAPPGTALMLSYILRPSVAALPQVSMIGALAVGDILVNHHSISYIKYPNDVQIDGQKVCGILAVASWEGEMNTTQSLRGVVIGIGINIRVPFADTPFSTSASNVESVGGAIVNRAYMLATLVARLDDWRGELGTAGVYETWRGRLNMIGRRVTSVQAGETLEGVAESVDADGGLHLRLDTGETRRIIAGEIALALENEK